MPPENLPIVENSYKNGSDWWIFDKISETETFKNLKDNYFSNSPQAEKWWNFSLSTMIILVLSVIGLTIVFQNKNFISDTFPNTIAVIKKINVIPELFTDIDFNLESRYNLSSILISLDDNEENNNEIITTIPNTSEEKPVKIIISKIDVNSNVANPTSKNITTLNDALKLGAVRYPDSGLLDGNKNIFIFGHSTSLTTETSYYKTFNNLEKLVVGDEVILQSANNEYTYKVTSVSITNTEEGLVEFSNNKELILSTCNTLGQKEERIIVQANFIKKRSLTNTTVTPQAGPGSNSVYEIINDPTTPISLASDLVDFTANIDSIGIINSEGQFIASSTPNTKNKIAVKFTIKNIGNKKSDNWYFNAVLPTSPYHIFSSKSQQALAPGEKIEFTMGFDRPKIGENQLIIINVDPSGGIKEPNKTNNIVKEFITIVE